MKKRIINKYFCNSYHSCDLLITAVNILIAQLSNLMILLSLCIQGICSKHQPENFRICKDISNTSDWPMSLSNILLSGFILLRTLRNIPTYVPGFLT